MEKKLLLRKRQLLAIKCSTLFSTECLWGPVSYNYEDFVRELTILGRTDILDSVNSQIK